MIGICFISVSYLFHIVSKCFMYFFLLCHHSTAIATVRLITVTAMKTLPHKFCAAHFESHHSDCVPHKSQGNCAAHFESHHSDCVPHKSSLVFFGKEPIHSDYRHTQNMKHSYMFHYIFLNHAILPNWR